MKKIKQNSAITLIALVITIIVLLILAAVTLNLVLGENGIFNKAKTAKEQHQSAQEDEKMQIGRLDNEIENHVNGDRGTVTIPEEEYNMLKNATSYSTTAKKVGKYLNGEDIYQKTINIEDTITIKIVINNALNLIGIIPREEM